MTGQPAHYSLIQYCPDRFRSEAVNVGLIVFSENPRLVRTRVLEGLRRLKKVFSLSESDVDRAARELRGIESRVLSSEIEAFDEWIQFIQSRANAVQLTQPRLVKVQNIDIEFNQLFLKLVGRDEHASVVAAVRDQPQQLIRLDQEFGRLVGEGRAVRVEQVTVPVLERTLDVPYAYQNGVLNLVKPQEFKNVRKATEAALQLAVEGDLLHRHPVDRQRQLIVVSAGTPGTRTRKAEEAVAPLFEEYNVRLVRSNEFEGFLDEVETQAH